MAWAATFQDAGSGVGAWFGVERRGEERERGVAKQKGEERAAEGSSRRGWARRRGNGGGCGSRVREQKLASAFMGEQGGGEGDGRGQGGRAAWAARAAAAALGRTRLSPSVACAVEREVSEGSMRARVGVMAWRSEAAARWQQ